MSGRWIRTELWSLDSEREFAAVRPVVDALAKWLGQGDPASDPAIRRSLIRLSRAMRLAMRRST
jgi:hypothetical protein